jgi:hypothetical protein
MTKWENPIPSVAPSDSNTLRRIFESLGNWSSTLGDVPSVYYGAFSDFTDQTNPVANTARAMTFNTTDLSNGVSIVSSSRITVANAGSYNFQWSGQFQNTDTQEHDVYVWVRINGTDVVGSTGYVAVISSHGGISGHTLPSWNYVFDLEANDYVQFYWSSGSTLVSLQTFAAGSTPTKPSTASLVLTVTEIAGIGPQGPQGPIGLTGTAGATGPAGPTGPMGGTYNVDGGDPSSVYGGILPLDAGGI